MNHEDEMNRMLAIVTRRQIKKCATCGTEFEAEGLQGYCDSCSIEIDRKAALPPLGKMCSSWPALHREAIPSMEGPSAEFAEKMAPRLFGNRMAILYGDRGRGKTQIATYCAYYRMMKGHDSGMYAVAFDLANSITGFDRHAKLEAIQRLPFLCLDECHRVEPRYLGLLESIIDARYRSKRSTLIIGNWMTEEQVRNGGNLDGERLYGLGPSIMSRIEEHKKNKTGGMVRVAWKSYRSE
jgi:DNA replication protein DnaC